MKNKIKEAYSYLVFPQIRQNPSSHKEGIENVDASEYCNVDGLLLEKSHGFVV